MTARYETIAGWVNEFGWTTGVELGVFDGRTHFHLLEQCPALKLVGVDLWGDSFAVAGRTQSGERCMCPYCSETRAARKAATMAEMEASVTARSDRHPRSRIVRAHTSQDAAAAMFALFALTGRELADFVFVDGDHSREGVSADVAVWKREVRPGGRLIGHDYNMRSVRDGIFEHFAPGDIETGDDHLWWATL
jgi:hypothetical protein